MNTFEYEMVIIKKRTVRLKCSNCAQLLPTTIQGHSIESLFSYCPYCGAINVKRIKEQEALEKEIERVIQEEMEQETEEHLKSS